MQEVEREISFRTENGLYYSYFKHLTWNESKPLTQSIHELKVDNLTEHLNTVNIISRFNIYQEIVLAIIYKAVAGFGLKPIVFYVNVVFSLQGLYLAVKFLLTWHLSGSWLAGVLMTAFVVVHRHNLTRVLSSIALREHFSMPFVFAQFLVVGRYLEKCKQSKGSDVICNHLLS